MVVIIEEMLVGIEGMEVSCLLHGKRADTAEVAVEKGSAVAVACPAVEEFRVGSAVEGADTYEVGIGFLEVESSIVWGAVEPIGGIVALHVVGVAMEAAFDFGFNFIVFAFLYVAFERVFGFGHGL